MTSIKIHTNKVPLYTLLRTLLLMLLMALMTLHLRAQSTQPQSESPTSLPIAFMAKAYEDSIVLRWAPTAAEQWLLGNKNGYKIWRIDLSSGKAIDYQLLTPTPLKPFSKQRILQGLDTTSEATKYIAVAEKMLYETQKSVDSAATGNFINQIKIRHSALVLRHMIAMMCADYDPAAAAVLALRWVDKDVQKGHLYTYLLYTEGQNKDGLTDTIRTMVLNNKEVETPPLGLEIHGFDKKAEIRWNRRQTTPYAGYLIEKSSDGHSFTALTESPFNSMYSPATGDPKKDSVILLDPKNEILKNQQVYTDSLTANYQNFYYRIRGITPFGELGPYSETLHIQGRDLTPPMSPFIDSAYALDEHRIQIDWSLDSLSPDLAGFYIDRADNIKGPFVTVSPNLLTTTTRSFIDTGAVANKGNYYVVLALDTAGNVSVSSAKLAYLKDNTPPAGPAPASGTIDSFGVVRLSWPANTEGDLMGYYVYRSLNPDYDFSQVSNNLLTDTSFVDTVSNDILDRQVYYKIIALDKNYNRSAFSRVSAIKKAVIIAPPAPVIRSVKASEAGIKLEIIPNDSYTTAQYLIVRKQKDSADFKLIGKIAEAPHQASLTFIDSSITPNIDYYYAVCAEDTLGILSENSYAVHARFSKLTTLSPVGQLNVQLVENKQAVTLNWSYQHPGNYFFLLYRSVNGGPMQLWQNISKEERKTTDVTANKGRYQYFIKVIDLDKKAESTLTSSTVISIP